MKLFPQQSNYKSSLLTLQLLLALLTIYLPESHQDLIYAFQAFRHGHRDTHPASSHVNNNNKVVTDELNRSLNGKDNITPSGMRQAYILGMHMRKTYLQVHSEDDITKRRQLLQFLDEENLEKEVKFLSTQQARTTQTYNSWLLGFRNINGKQFNEAFSEETDQFKMKYENVIKSRHRNAMAQNRSPNILSNDQQISNQEQQDNLSQQRDIITANKMIFPSQGGQNEDGKLNFFNCQYTMDKHLTISLSKPEDTYFQKAFKHYTLLGLPKKISQVLGIEESEVIKGGMGGLYNYCLIFTAIKFQSPALDNDFSMLNWQHMYEAVTTFQYGTVDKNLRTIYMSYAMLRMRDKMIGKIQCFKNATRDFTLLLQKHDKSDQESSQFFLEYLDEQCMRNTQAKGSEKRAGFIPNYEVDSQHDINMLLFAELFGLEAEYSYFDFLSTVIFELHIDLGITPQEYHKNYRGEVYQKSREIKKEFRNYPHKHQHKRLHRDLLVSVAVQEDVYDSQIDDTQNVEMSNIDEIEPGFNQNDLKKYKDLQILQKLQRCFNIDPLNATINENSQISLDCLDVKIYFNDYQIFSTELAFCNWKTGKCPYNLFERWISKLFFHKKQFYYDKCEKEFDLMEIINYNAQIV
eukprot:403351469